MQVSGMRDLRGELIANPRDGFVLAEHPDEVKNRWRNSRARERCAKRLGCLAKADACLFAVASYRSLDGFDGPGVKSCKAWFQSCKMRFALVAELLLRLGFDLKRALGREKTCAIDQLDQLRITTPNGLVPLANLVTREPRQRVNVIERKDGRFVMTAKANVEDDVLADDKVKEIQAWLDRQTWDPNLAFVFRGADEEQKESGQFLGMAMLGALFVMFIILITQFNSFSQAGITLSTIVLSVAGVLLGMLITGQKFSVIMTGTGIVALAGIVVNNSIVLIDTFNRLRREQGIDTIEAVLLACAQRLRPVLLTTVTTVFGLLPMALQINVDFFTPAIAFGSVTSIWWVQLSTAVISGLTFATIITLVLTPAWLAAPAVFAARYNAWRYRARSGAVRGGDMATPVPAE